MVVKVVSGQSLYETSAAQCSHTGLKMREGKKNQPNQKTSRAILACAWMSQRHPEVLSGKRDMEKWSCRTQSEPGRSFLIMSTKTSLPMNRNHLRCWVEYGKSMATKISKGRDITILKIRGKNFCSNSLPILNLVL